MDFRDDLPTARYILDINTLMNVLTKYFQKQLGLSRDAIINEQTQEKQRGWKQHRRNQDYLMEGDMGEERWVDYKTNDSI